MALIKEIEKTQMKIQLTLNNMSLKCKDPLNVGSFDKYIPSTNPIGRISIRLLEEK